MCGIAGYISLKGAFPNERFREAVSLIQHRGPDAEGFYFSEDGRVALAHRRLSIIDLSASANQPMFSANGRYCIVYNGEVYNFKELISELNDKGASLKTTSDTEVILELFAQQGAACFTKLNGMFAFAIYDIKEQVITLCRDHAGIKPLFYYQDDQQLIFGSELKVIRALMANHLTINKTAVPYFLHLGFIPQPLTIYNNTYKFASAHYVQIPAKNNSLVSVQQALQPFWKLENEIEAVAINDEAVAKKQLNELLLDAVEKQLVSDVPIGTFLSGGVDSSLVTALATKVSPLHKIKTFSIAIADGKYNESAFSTKVADFLNTEHYEFSVKEKEVLEMMPQLVPTYDEPFADSSALPTMMVSKLARQHVTVTLSGDGGDELFYGYGMYAWAKRLSHPLIPFVKDSLFFSSKFLNQKYQRAGNLFAYPGKSTIRSHIFSQEQYFFREQELSSLLTDPAFDFSGINQMPPFNRKLSAEEEQGFWDFNYYLKDDLLVKVDRASMLYSLESRVPLLDYRIIEFAHNLNSNLKMNGKVMKYLLKEVLYDYLPREIFNRPKWGFSIPLDKWLNTDLKYLVDTYTHKDIIEKHNLVKSAEVEKLRKAYFAGKSYLFGRLWNIIILHWWLEENLTAIIL